MEITKKISVSKGQKSKNWALGYSQTYRDHREEEELARNLKWNKEDTQKRGGSEGKS